MKTGLVISGGGSKGAFAVGALEVLLSNGFDFDVIAGTSTGALIASMVAIDDIDVLVKFYTSVKTKDVLRLNWRRLWWDGLYDVAPLRKILRQQILKYDGGRRYKQLMQSRRDVLLCSVSLQTKALTYFSQRKHIEQATPWTDANEFVECLLSSTVEPFYTRPINIRNEQYVDGGIRAVYPIDVLKQANCRRIIVIGNQPEFAPEVDNKKKYSFITSIGFRSIDIMMSEIIRNDMLHATCDSKSDITVIRPDVSLTKISGLSGLKFHPDGMQKMRELGQEQARKVLDL